MAEREKPSVWHYIGGFILIVVIGFIIFFFVSSGKADVVFKQAWTNVEPGAEAAGQGLFGWWEYISTGGKAERDFGSVVEDNVDNSNLGVKITAFEGLSHEFQENKPIQLFSSFEMAGLSGEWENVLLNCSLEDYKGDVFVEPYEFSYYGDGNLEIKSAICKFPNGIKVIGQTFAGKIAKITAISEYTQLVTYRAYFMGNDEYLALRTLGKNPFIENGINYQYLIVARDSNIIRSVVTDGPLNIGIEITESQPFTEGKRYIPLRVTFSNKKFTGELVKINDFELILSNLIELNNDPNYCDFKFIRSEGEHNVYGLTEAAKEEKIKGGFHLPYSNPTLVCQFRVVEEFPAEFSDIFYTVFGLEAKYDYAEEKEFVVQIRDVEDDGVDACSYITNKYDCIEANNCKYHTVNGNFEECLACSYSSCGAEYKSNEELCINNPCKFSGGCWYDSGGFCRSEGESGIYE